MGAYNPSVNEKKRHNGRMSKISQASLSTKCTQWSDFAVHSEDCPIPIGHFHSYALKKILIGERVIAAIQRTITFFDELILFFKVVQAIQIDTICITAIVKC